MLQTERLTTSAGADLDDFMLQHWEPLERKVALGKPSRPILPHGR
jgi:hypothetical protein